MANFKRIPVRVIKNIDGRVMQGYQRNKDGSIITRNGEPVTGDDNTCGLLRTILVSMAASPLARAIKEDDDDVRRTELMFRIQRAEAKFEWMTQPATETEPAVTSVKIPDILYLKLPTDLYSWLHRMLERKLPLDLDPEKARQLAEAGRHGETLLSAVFDLNSQVIKAQLQDKDEKSILPTLEPEED